MKVAMIGAGNIGGALGKKWAKAGHDVRFGVRNPDDKDNKALVQECGSNARATTVADAVDGADVVVFAIPGGAMADTVGQLAAKLAGKTIIDATNHMGGAAMNSLSVIQERVPTAKGYRAFNSVGFENFENPRFGDVQADLFYCGPDGESKKSVEKLISDVGLRPVRVGGIDKVGVVDMLASLWFALALGEKRGRHLAFKMLTR